MTPISKRVEPINTLRSGEELTVEVKAGQGEYFDYKIETRFFDLDTSFLFLECSSKKETQVYVSTKHLYPYELEHKWAFGDLSPDFVEKLKSNASMRDILTEATPFDITGDGEIKYQRHFPRPELFKPELAHIENADKISELMSYGAASVSDSGIRVILESECWRFISSVFHMSVFNTSPEDRVYRVKVTELKDCECLPPELQQRYSAFSELFSRDDA